MRAISRAAASCGLIIIESPSSSLIYAISSLYTGLLTRAIVLHPPDFFAIRQHSRFSSSEPVTATIKSASSTPASDCTWKLAPFPTIPSASHDTDTLSTSFCLVSITVMSCPSELNCSASAAPTLPQPTINIFISAPIRIFVLY